MNVPDLTGLESVIVAAPDVQGRLVGSRLEPEYFRDSVLTDGFAVCSYLFAVDVEMEHRAGYGVDAWGGGFGDTVLRPDLATWRRLPWDEATALVIADTTLAVAPRQVLRSVLDRLAARGLRAFAGTELEFLLFREDYQAAWEGRPLTPATRYNVDYSLSGLESVDPVVRRIRTAMREAGLTIESSRAECHPGQYEIVFRYDEALRTCDNHALYKLGAKAIAAQSGVALTFMAKYDSGEGNSCHVHLSLRSLAGEPVFATDNALFQHFVAGVLACAREFTLLSAPTINSYKRFAPEAFAPTTIAWGYDNRTCPVRVVGAGESLRIEFRVPGGDANPYLAVAGLLAAGLYGVERELPLEEPFVGNAFTATGRPRLPETLNEALALWENSGVARECFSDEVVAHYAAAARAELAAFASTVTDWERRRAFERL